MFTNILIPDITRYFFAERSMLGDTKRSGGKPCFGTRSSVFKILDELETEPIKFWTDLVLNYLIKNPVREVMMVPDAKLAKHLDIKEVFQYLIRKADDLKSRQISIGKSGLIQLKKSLDLAVIENSINIAPEVIQSMPPIPNVSRAPILRATQKNIEMSEIDPTLLFKSCQVVRIDTKFVHFGLFLDITILPENLRPYLVLFQELLFQSDICIPSKLDKSREIIMNYKEVVKYSSELFISHGIGVGFGNSIFSTSWCSQILTLFTTSRISDFERMIRFAIQVLFFTKFTIERITTISKNLLTSLTEMKV